MKIVVGLGNPGAEYELTRHNLGFMVLDALASKIGLAWEKNNRCRAHLAKNGELLLVKPQTYVNLSGQSAAAVLAYFHLLPKTLGLVTKKDSNLADILTVVHDDLDISFGKFKVSVDSRSAGHKGVDSIIKHLKTKNFRRVRIGIKTATAQNIPAEKFVLAKFAPSELAVVENVVDQIINTEFTALPLRPAATSPY